MLQEYIVVLNEMKYAGMLMQVQGFQAVQRVIFFFKDYQCIVSCTVTQ